jgi:hypothetical protein
MEKNIGLDFELEEQLLDLFYVEGKKKNKIEEK